MNPETYQYPQQYETEAVLKDGSSILLRPIKKDDVQLWLDFVGRLSPHTKYLHFQHVPNLAAEDAVRACSVDYDNTFAIVAEVMESRRKKIVGIGRYYRLPDRHSAEVTFITEDAHQGKGIATRLLGLLVDIARDRGIDRFETDVLAEEGQLAFFRNYGFHIVRSIQSDVHRISFSVAQTEQVIRKEEARESAATIASLRYILSPRSVAVIGASRDKDSIGNVLFRCILQSDFSGVIYPVNPNADAVVGVRTYPSVLDIPGNVEMAVIAVPASIVNRLAHDCGQKGVRALIVISDGFKETGPEGMARERELREICLGHGMRVVGPNCMGVINTEPAVGLNATFSTVYPPRGNVAFLSQSGAMGLAILEYARDLNMGISSFVSVGNRLDISPSDLLQYWEKDTATRVILLYLESFGNPEKFALIARRVSAKKPIVVVKSGTTKAGTHAAASHTGAMATSEVAAEVMFHHAGIVKVNTMEELFDVAALLSNQPLPKGNRLAIVTNGGGPGIIAADAAERNGLELPPVSEETAEKLGKVLKRKVTINNPLDTTAGASAEEFENILRILAGDKDNDAVLIIFVPPIVVNPEAIENALQRVAPVFWRRKKPLLACFLGRRGLQARIGTLGRLVPSFSFPEEAVASLARAVEYVDLQSKPKGVIPDIKGTEPVEAHKIVESALRAGVQRPIWLSAEEIIGLLNCYGIKMGETVMAETPDEAAAAAERLGFPVVVKLASTTIVHKTEVNGVVLDVTSSEGVKMAFDDIRKRLSGIGRKDEMQGVLIQKMVREGIETIIGVTHDPQFGPLIMFGLGGIYAELFKDTTIRLHPLTDVDAGDMIQSVKMAKLLSGYRGLPSSDTNALEDLLLRLSKMIEDVPQIVELDFNPVKVLPRGRGYYIADARILVG
ncbi:MAG: GNAT family N-acetyltransferase [Dehalococcoidales bacterium]|nr:GNAT family N-acetyltransferase [Dehalococcoidales bacterium]